MSAHFFREQHSRQFGFVKALYMHTYIHTYTEQIKEMVVGAMVAVVMTTSCHHEQQNRLRNSYNDP